jgi:hypothetical protein
MSDRQLRFTSLAAAEAELGRLTRAGLPSSGKGWNWAQTLTHCAQSIEFSMTGFPVSRGRLFQRTVGAAAFGVFRRRGVMSHGLSEPIPGAPALEAGVDPGQALERLRRAIDDFRRGSGPLRPHFAYGLLERPLYEQAHAMHLAHHLSAFRPGS